MKKALDTAAQNRYRAFCAQAPDLPLFMEAWYLDAACGTNNWAAVTLEKSGKTVAVWPYFFKEKLGYRYVVMPPLVRAMGPYVLPFYRGLRYDQTLYEGLLAQLPNLIALEQDFPYTITNWLPFYWQKFQQTTRYSYFLPLRDLETVWQGMSADYRNRILPKATQEVYVHGEGTLEQFWAVHEKSFIRQGMVVPFDRQLLDRLDTALQAHHARKIFFAAHKQTGTLHAVAYLVWDKQTAWLLMAGDDPAYRASGASILVIWEAIQYAANILQLPTFDFAGSMLQRVEYSRRQFGAQQRPYFRLSKTWKSWWGWARKLRQRE